MQIKTETKAHSEIKSMYLNVFLHWTHRIAILKLCHFILTFTLTGYSFRHWNTHTNREGKRYQGQLKLENQLASYPLSWFSYLVPAFSHSPYLLFNLFLLSTCCATPTYIDMFNIYYLYCIQHILYIHIHT